MDQEGRQLLLFVARTFNTQNCEYGRNINNMLWEIFFCRLQVSIYCACIYFAYVTCFTAKHEDASRLSRGELTALCFVLPITRLTRAVWWAARRWRLQQRGWRTWAAQRGHVVPPAAWLTEPHHLMSADRHRVLPASPPLDSKNWIDWSLCGPVSRWSPRLGGKE